MTIKKNYVNPNVAESSFRKLLKDKPFGIKKDLIVHALKNIAYHSFDEQNIFEHEYIDGRRRTKLVHQVTVNRENAYNLANRSSHDDYNLKIPGIVIPLNCETNPLLDKGRLVLTGPITGPIKIEIQFRFKGSKEWAIIPAGPSNVLAIITNVLQE